MAKSNKAAGVILLLFFGLALKMALSFPPRAMYFPVFVTGTGVFLSILMIAGSFFGKKEKEDATEALGSQGQKMAAVMLAAMVLYVIGMQVIGFCVSTLVFLIVSMIINFPGKPDKKTIVRIAVVSVGVTVLIYAVFKLLLYVPLPKGFLI